MKTSRLWIQFIVHSFKHQWRWKPSLVKTQIIFNSGSKMWLVPHLEFCWLFLVLYWTSYSKKTEYKGNSCEDDCSIEMLQDRINVLEKAIKNHKDKTIGKEISEVDIELWSILE